MNDRYDRSVCASELLIRNAIIQKMVSGLAMVGSFHLPDTVPGTERIGKAQTKAPTVENSLGVISLSFPPGKVRWLLSLLYWRPN